MNSMASESSGLSEFTSTGEGFEAPEIHITVQTEAKTTINYENIVFPNAPIQK
jgi:hypothetical protein